MQDISYRPRRKGYGYSINRVEKKLDINFDVYTLDIMASYVISENKLIRRSHLVSMRNLFNLINLDNYKNEMDKLNRVRFIRKLLEAKIESGITDKYIAIKYANGGILENDILDVNDLPEINSKEIEWINNTISTSLKYSFIWNDADRGIDLFTRFKNSDFNTKAQIVSEIESYIDQFKANFRRCNIETNNEIMFSLKPGYYEDTVREFHKQLTNPASRIYCGMQGLNEMFGGALESGRCYMFLGASGNFKSGIMLTMANQIKKYNKNYILKDPTKRPAVVLLTMENTVKESIERLFNMTTVNDNIRNFDSETVIQMLKTQGELYITDDNPIDIIIKYKPNGSVDTGYLYTLCEELEDEGVEVICFIQDYVRRIRSIYNQPDVRTELGEIINEFKVFAIIKDIPVITAGQLNREASAKIEAGVIAKKSDLIRQLGRSNTGESMLMIDNSDWAGIINMEYDSYGNKFLGVQVAKIRNNKISRSVIFLPFENNNSIKLVEDVFLPTPVFKETLKDTIHDMNTFNTIGTTNRVNSQGITRRTIDEISAEKASIKDDEEELFTSSIIVPVKELINPFIFVR